MPGGNYQRLIIDSIEQLHLPKKMECRRRVCVREKVSSHGRAGALTKAKLMVAV